jgi:hypothetical protein
MIQLYQRHKPPPELAAAGRWLLLIHQIPPKPDYFRVKVRRRLQRLGAVALKSSVYVLPNRNDTREDFEWLRGEIVADGGEATLCAAALLAGASDAELEGRFRAERDADYAESARAAREPAADGVRLRRRLEEVTAVDFFGAPGRADAERALAALEHAAGSAAPERSATSTPAASVRGRTWVTREGVFVDRIASSWLVRHFIDPQARFKFVPARGYRPRPGELRFDMFQGEFTHEGDRCTFETLLARFALDDPALGAIAEIVHDIDCKDEKFARPEAPGVASVLAGLARAYADDAQRVEHGATVFDALYAQLGRGAR